MSKMLAVMTVLLLLLTVGCGFAIHYGGEAFRGAIRGHMILGILTLLIAMVLLVKAFQ